MDIHGYSAHVLVNGRKVKEYRKDGLTFIEAKDGTEFAIEVKNHLSNRVLAIISIDGLDVIDGKLATDKSRGYIVNGYNADTFHGWRKSDTEVANFKFTTSGQSYATEKGNGANNGVIAVKLLAEKVKVPVWHQQAFVNPTNWPINTPYQPQPYFGVNTTGSAPVGSLYRGGGTSMGLGRTLTADYSSKGQPTFSILRQDVNQFGKLERIDSSVMFSSCVDNEAANFDMGTTWGSKREDKATTTEFEYGNELATLTFYYASREALKAMGIPLVNERQISLPQAFVGATYAQPPKNWRA
jgi:hypothetical protein